MMSRISMLASGLLFGAGLALSGMTQPSKVMSFLDFTGDWDPSLAFVMAGAIAVHAVLYRVVRRRPSPLFQATFHVPTRRDVDPRLVAGAAIFGLGWGLGGFCPGPGIVSAASLDPSALVFVAAMLGGMLIQHALDAAQKKGAQKPRETTGAEVLE
jgi:uncharacterized membrane protein YedE/YeeE